jgi:hypothetical protein
LPRWCSGVTRDGQRRTEATIKANIQACERGKRDRFDDARVFEAMASYYDGVTQAASVKQDVKRIAARVRDTLLVRESHHPLVRRGSPCRARQRLLATLPFDDLSVGHVACVYMRPAIGHFGRDEDLLAALRYVRSCLPEDVHTYVWGGRVHFRLSDSWSLSVTMDSMSRLRLDVWRGSRRCASLWSSPGTGIGWRTWPGAR